MVSQPTQQPAAPAGGSLSDILTAIKNLVTAVATASNGYLNVQGQTNACGITTPTVVKTGTGRLAQIVLIDAGSATGMVYDSVSTTNTTKPLYPIENSGGPAFVANMPYNLGLMVVPGAGQKVTVSYS